MEATGIYSMPVYDALVEHGGFAEVLVCNAGHVKNVPGRKTDFSDAEWLARLLECGLLAGSFIPGGDQGGPGRDPLPGESGRPAGQRDRPAGQRAARRRDQDRLRGILDRDQVRAGDDRGADRRGTPRPGPGPAGPGQDARQDPGSVRGPWKAASATTTR
jgi:hypothetical protein